MNDTHTVPEKYITHRVTGEKGRAAKIAFPETEAAIADYLKQAAAQKQSVITVGASTGLTGATFPQTGEWLLSLEHYRNILSLDEETLTLHVQSGVTLAEIQDYLEPTPYFYAPDPGSKQATIGGTAATNAGGMRAVKYGVTRENIRSMVVFLADGSKLAVGSLNNKDSSGYDLKDLFIGSEGTLGVITELGLKLRPKPAAKVSVVIGFEQLDDLAPVVYQILGSSLQPAALEFFDREAIRYAERFLAEDFLEIEGECFLLLTLDGSDEESVAQQLTQLSDASAKMKKQSFQSLREEQAQRIWRLRGAIGAGIEHVTQQEPLDVVVPINQITATIKRLRVVCLQSNLRAVFFGHAGDGNIHICLLREGLPQEEWEERLAVVLHQIYQEVAKRGGLPSAEHGIGLLKKPYFKEAIDPVKLQVMRQLKQALDPQNRLNPGKIFDITDK